MRIKLEPCILREVLNFFYICFSDFLNFVFDFVPEPRHKPN